MVSLLTAAYAGRGAGLWAGGIFFSGSLGGWWFFFGRDLAASAGRRNIVVEIETLVPSVRRRFSAALDLALAGAVAAGESLAMARAFVAGVGRALPPGLNAWPRRRHVLAVASVAVGVSAAWAIAASVVGGHLRAGARAVTGGRSSGSEIFLYVRPGDARIGARQRFVVVTGLRRPTTTCPSLVIEGGAKPLTYEMKRVTENTFRLDITAPSDDFSYFIVAGEERSRRFKVEVMPPPVFEGLEIIVFAPAYSGLPPRTFTTTERGIPALAGSNVVVVARGRGAISATLKRDDAKVIACRPEDDRFVARFTADHTTAFRIELSSQWGRASSPTYQLNVNSDERPVVEVISPGRDLSLADAARAPKLRFTCTDDFGITGIRVVYYNETSAENFIADLGSAGGAREFEGECDLVPAALSVFPGDVVAYYVEAVDNDAVNGPKVGRSFTYRFRFPSAEEIYEVTRAEVAAGEEELETLRDDLRSLTEDVGKISAGADAGVNRQALRELVANQERLRRALEDAIRNLEKNAWEADEMALSPELVAKLMEARRLLDEALTEAQKEVLQKLNEALRQVDPARVRDLMSQIKLDQQELEKRLDAAINILKEARREELLRELASQAEALSARQDEANAALLRGDRPRAAEEALAVMKDLQALGSAAEETAKEFDEVSPAVAKTLRAESKSCKEGDVAKGVRRSAEAMAANASDASEAGARAAEGLRDLAARLDALAREYREGSRRQLLAEIDRVLEDVILASYELERFTAAMAGSGGNVEGGSEGQARRGRGIAAAIAGLSDAAGALAEKSFFVSPVAAEALAEAASEMTAAARNCELGNYNRASEGGKRACAAMNLAAAALLDARANALAAGSAGGLAEMIEEMKGLAAGQRQLNEESRALFSFAPGASAVSLRAALERLAAEQALIRARLERLASVGRGGGGAEAGNVGELAKEAQTIEEELKNSGLTERVLEKQEKLLERMLTSIRALRVQGRSSRRRSEPGRDYEPAVAPPLPRRLTTPERSTPPAPALIPAGGVPSSVWEATGEFYRRLAEEF